MTTNVKHTPGPWKTDSNTITGQYTLVFDRAGDLVAHTAHGMDPADIDVYGPECEANARLIAAAPDLLAACQELVALWQAEGGRLLLSDSPSIVRARAAIAKAGGVA